MQWFRMYAEFLADPVIQSLAFEDQRHYVAILCLKCNGTLDRKMAPGARDRIINRGLGLDSLAAEEAKRRLMEVALIDGKWQPKGWDKRQFNSDDSSGRVKKYREKRVANGLPMDTSGYRRHWSSLVELYGEECVYCGATDKLCIDHIYPVSAGGTDDFDNLAIACKACNSGKAGRTPEQSGHQIRNEKVRQRYDLYRNRNGYETVPRARATETEAEQNRTETELTTANAVDVVRGTTCPAGEIVNLYHEALPSLRRVADLTPARRQQLKARWSQAPSLEDWRKFFEYVGESDFLMGRGRPRPGSEKPFQADFDWLTKQANFVKVIEGKYHA